jgi:hypothetical protein
VATKGLPFSTAISSRFLAKFAGRILAADHQVGHVLLSADADIRGRPFVDFSRSDEPEAELDLHRGAA